MPSQAKIGKKTTTPDRSTAAAFPRYLTAEVVRCNRVKNMCVLHLRFLKMMGGVAATVFTFPAVLPGQITTSANSTKGI